MKGQINQILYQFSRYFLFGRTVTQWLVIGLLISPFLCLLTTLSANPWRWAVFAILLLISLALLGLMWLIRKQGYVTFEAEPTTEVITPEQLNFPDKLNVYISGYLSVGKATHYFANEAGHYQTFQTRERVIMLETTPKRLLLLATTREKGWWYLFFMPKTVQSLTVGRLSFGRYHRPAIALTILPEDSETPQSVYLSFDTIAERSRVLADLFIDDLQAKLI